MEKDTSEPWAPERRSVAGSIRAARRIAQPPELSAAITDVPYRAVSIFPSLLLARLGVTPNRITVTWGILGVAGAMALACPDYGVRLTGAVLLEVSYLLDYVDGEVARLLNRISRRGFFIDLVAHGLIKTSLFLAAGYGVYRSNPRSAYLLLALSAAVSVANGYALPFYAAYARVQNVPPSDGLRSSPRSTARRLLGLAGYLFESPGFYGLVLLGTIFNRLSWVVIFYGIFAPLWLLYRLVRYRYE